MSGPRRSPEERRHVVAEADRRRRAVVPVAPTRLARLPGLAWRSGRLLRSVLALRLARLAGAFNHGALLRRCGGLGSVRLAGRTMPRPVARRSGGCAIRSCRTAAAAPLGPAGEILRTGRIADPRDGCPQHALDVLELLRLLARNDGQRAPFL